MDLGVVASPIKVSFVDSVLFPYNYSFGDDDSATSSNNKILNEVSACRFVDDSHVALVGDSGELFFASVQLDEDEDKLQVKILLQVPLDLPGFAQAVDSEGCVIMPEYPESILVSSETPLALTWFDRATGIAQNGTDFPFYQVPEYVQNRTQTNKGFEAVTDFTSHRLVVDPNTSFIATSTFILTTTEGELQDDPIGYHHFLIWDAYSGGDPIVELGHWASRWKESGSHNEFLAISEMEFWSEKELLLLLERGYDGSTNMIRLWSVELGFPVTRNRQLLLEWTNDIMQLTRHQKVQLQVDNYEAICLFPKTNNNESSLGRRHLLLINDDNHNPEQIGTQFVVLRLEDSPASLLPQATQKPSLVDCDQCTKVPSQKKLGPTMVKVIVISSISLLFLLFSVAAVCRWGKRRKNRVPLNQEDIDREGSDDISSGLELS